MDIYKLLKDYWHIITVIIAAIFIVGIYYMKIEYMSAEIANNSKNVETLNRTVYILVGTIQKEYPGINISAYLQASTLHNIPIKTTVSGLTSIAKSTPQTGKLFLMKNMGFTKEQASSVFKQSKSQND